MPGREDYVRFFENADKDNSGSLSLDELVEALRNAGYQGSDDKLRSMFIHADTSGDNMLTLDEFLVAMGEQPEETHTAASMMYVFRMFDKNNDGTIDRKEMEAVLKEMRKSVSEKEIERVMELMDKNQDGAINYKEFLEYYGYNTEDARGDGKEEDTSGQ